MFNKLYKFVSTYSVSYRIYIFIISSGLLYAFQSTPFLGYWSNNSSLSSVLLSLLWMLPFIIWHICLGLYLRISYLKYKKVSYFKYLVRLGIFHIALLTCYFHPLLFPILLFLFCVFGFSYLVWNFAFLTPASEHVSLVRRSSTLSDPRKDKK